MDLTIRYYAKHNIRHNEKTFKMGHAFSKKELEEFGNEDIERLLKNKSITTNRKEVSDLLERISEQEKQFRISNRP